MLSKIYKSSVALMLSLVFGVFAFAQDTQIRNVAAGQKMKIKGVVVAKDNEKIIVRDTMGVDTKVTLSTADIKVKGGIFGGGDKVASSQIVRGLNLEIEGVGDNAGNLAATKVRFSKNDLKVAQSIDSRVSPAEDRLSQAEENAQRLSGQIDELVAVSNAARGGAKAAQDSADAAIAGVNATNQRISALDDFVVQSTAIVNFTSGSAVLSPEGKAQLDQIAQQALTLRGYSIEVTGFTDTAGSVKNNKVLSQKRAQAVIDYLIETHNIPLRRIGQSYGYGETQAVASTTREGRAQNRRVEIKLLVSRGMNQNVEVKKDEATPNQ
jgi:outer membrane protein OmpA-like peptidoglycan-associated protein